MTAERNIPTGVRRLGKTTLALLLASVLVPNVADAKPARCLIKQNGATAYSGACLFHLERGGSFSIRRSDTNPILPILPSVTDITVSIISPGVAEVRGLTTDGINSRWGTAIRSKVDAACWTGSDFEVCAY
jgi:hypothetical protein